MASSGGVRTRVLGLGMSRRFERGLRRRHLPRPHGPGTAPVTDADLASLPTTAQRYLYAMGVVGRPRARAFDARFEGRFRLSPDKPWVPCVALQRNTVEPISRAYSMRLDLFGVLPMFGWDVYHDGTGTMRGKLLGLVQVADGAGPEFDTGELTTWLNDAALLAPSMLLGSGVGWHGIDDQRVGLSVTDAGRTVRATLTVGDDGLPHDFVTTDRWCDLPDGLVRAVWSTPVDGWDCSGTTPVPTGARAVWMLDDGPFSYAEGRFADVRSEP